MQNSRMLWAPVLLAFVALGVVVGTVRALPADGMSDAGGHSPVAAASVGGSLELAAPMTSTVTATSTPSAPLRPTLTLTPTLTPVDTATPRPTTPPRPAYLPVLLRDPVCLPQASYSDVVFVLDVSKYMNNIRDGEEARLQAVKYMKQAIHGLDLDHARVGLVRFTDQWWVEQTLTNSRSAILAAVDTDPRRSTEKARMEMGLRVARDLLTGRAATPGNGKVIVFISELQAKSVPWENVSGCVEKRGEECAVLAAAREVKGAGITVYLWATSNANDGGQMLWADLATDRGKRYLLPTEADITKTLGELQVVKPCPADLFWPRSGRRP